MNPLVQRRQALQREADALARKKRLTKRELRRASRVNTELVKIDRHMKVRS